MATTLTSRSELSLLSCSCLALRTSDPSAFADLIKFESHAEERRSDEDVEHRVNRVSDAIVNDLAVDDVGPQGEIYSVGILFCAYSLFIRVCCCRHSPTVRHPGRQLVRSALLYLRVLRAGRVPHQLPPGAPLRPQPAQDLLQPRPGDLPEIGAPARRRRHAPHHHLHGFPVVRACCMHSSSLSARGLDQLQLCRLPSIFQQGVRTYNTSFLSRTSSQADPRSPPPPAVDQIF